MQQPNMPQPQLSLQQLLPHSQPQLASQPQLDSQQPESHLHSGSQAHCGSHAQSQLVRL